MAGERGRLTDLQIRHWVRAGVPMAKADGGGLTFTLSAGGATGWILRYSHGGRRRELTIGRYPDISLADARGIATIKRAEIMQGRNPAADKQKAKATAAKDWTVRELVKDYRAKKLVSLAHSTQVSYGRHLKRVEKKLGDQVDAQGDLSLECMNSLVPQTRGTPSVVWSDVELLASTGTHANLPVPAMLERRCGGGDKGLGIWSLALSPTARHNDAAAPSHRAPIRYRLDLPRQGAMMMSYDWRAR